jgi:hypothetical protein
LTPVFRGPTRSNPESPTRCGFQEATGRRQTDMSNSSRHGDSNRSPMRPSPITVPAIGSRSIAHATATVGTGAGEALPHRARRVGDTRRFGRASARVLGRVLAARYAPRSRRLAVGPIAGRRCDGRVRPITPRSATPKTSTRVSLAPASAARCLQSRGRNGTLRMVRRSSGRVFPDAETGHRVAIGGGRHDRHLEDALAIARPHVRGRAVSDAASGSSPVRGHPAAGRRPSPVTVSTRLGGLAIESDCCRWRFGGVVRCRERRGPPL